ncbi:MAG: hypothetical protein R3F34_04635 [Planctomycetota bacterium]
MPKILALAALLVPVALALLALSGCTIARPFAGPGYDRTRGVVAPGAGDTVVVAVTHAVLGGDGEARRRFWKDTSAVLAGLDDRSGLVGSSVRRRLLGGEAWTMTVWIDDDSLERFVRSDAHRAAMRSSSDAIAEMRFARVDVPADELPFTWERALRALDESNGYAAAR